MWLKLGDNELINLDHVISIRKGSSNTIEIQYADPKLGKLLPFNMTSDRDKAFDRLTENLIRLRHGLE